MAAKMNRRQFVQSGGALAGQALVGSSLFTLGCDFTHYGFLQEADENGIRLPRGFTSRVVAKSGQMVVNSNYVWHTFPDGGAVFPVDDGWIYVSNSEIPIIGGAGAVRFDSAANIVDAYPICEGTSINCAGGATPWGTWLSCEEFDKGRVFECDPLGNIPHIPRPALGVFAHEGVAADEPHGQLYLTEDRPDGRLYRFTPDDWENLESGLLEVAEVYDGDQVRWLDVPDPLAINQPTRRQVPASTPFKGGEGIVHHEGHVYFTTKGDSRVWDLDAVDQTISVLYERETDWLMQLGGLDNVAMTPNGDIMVAEDGGNMELVIMTPGRTAWAFLRIEGQGNSELTGPAFDPSGTRLYFSSQRGGALGITYEVTGPFIYGV